MTVKEAIDELKYSKDMCYFDPSTGETGKPYSEECERMAQALDIAIEALKNESGEQSEQKTGRWIYTNTIGGMRYYGCAICANQEKDCIADEHEIQWYNYCPNCGAKMESEVG